MSSGFIDLRTNDHGDSSHGGFWPSFTDIMMVVVMIFMLASVVLILRNWELVEALRNTMESERLAAELARSTSETNATLEEQLAQAQYQLSELRMQQMHLVEEGERQRATLTEREQQLFVLNGELQRETQQRQSAEEQLQLLREQSALKEQRIASLGGELATLEESHRRQGEELDRFRQSATQQTQQLASLQQEYDTLKVKYDKLVKPARTAKGKHVVEVRYEKLQGKPTIALRDSGEGELKTLSEEEMHARLAALKKANPNRLYIKIIIPADSGLSYSEAWSFMKGVLERYDYYYQE